MAALPETAVGRASSASQYSFFLEVPPFPGRRFGQFARLERTSVSPVPLGKCLALIREQRVGGAYWARQPAVPSTYLLVRSGAAVASCDRLIEQHGGVLLWLATPAAASLGVATIVGECDPWHMLGNAQALVCHVDDKLRLVAAILDVPTYLIDPSGARPQRWKGDVEDLFADVLPVAARFSNPFGEDALTLVGVIELCGFWRSLIDANRTITNGIGFAFWKQDSVLPLLWGGGEAAGFFDRSAADHTQGAVAIWRSKAPQGQIEQLEARGTTLVEVEDGFLRSAGLGADCVPPLSITVDRLGAYFDPSQPSELENLLQNGGFAQPLIARARTLRETIVAAGLGKYDRSDAVTERFDTTRRHVLVAGQVEDDRSILTGGAGLASNLELLQRVRAREPDCLLIYKPHPDVVAGHRKGHIHEPIARQFADIVITDASISSLIAMVDEVHVNTSLAGFEALMRHKDVTTYGAPFYAGWGLTHDLGPVPLRRTSKRSLDELVAATLLMYPRYLDPVTALPCPAEVVVDRLCAGAVSPTGLLVSARRIQGKLMRRLSWFAR